jgi:hypothetical protein
VQKLVHYILFSPGSAGVTGWLFTFGLFDDFRLHGSAVLVGVGLLFKAGFRQFV